MSVRAATSSEIRSLATSTGYEPPANARGLVAEGKCGVVGLVVIDQWTPNSAHMHVVVNTPAGCASLLREAFRYAFQHVGVLLGVVRASNAKSLSAARKAGFQEMRRVVDGWQKGEDLIVYEMRREECRWIERAA